MNKHKNNIRNKPMMKERNLMVRMVMAVLLAWLLPAESFAQKDIDRLVTKYSDKPYTVYTCIVRRNPRTRRVSKVIKSLTIANPSVYRQFENAFRAEGKRADYVNASNSNGGFASVLRFDKSAYIFSSDSGSQCTVTIIWRDDEGSDNLVPEDDSHINLNPLTAPRLKQEMELMTRNMLMQEGQFKMLESMMKSLEKTIEGSAAQMEGAEQLLNNFNNFSLEVITPED